MKRALLKTKWENISLPLTLYYSVIQIIKAHEDFKLMAVALMLTIVIGIYAMIRESRKEALAELRRLHIEEMIQENYTKQKEDLKTQQKHVEMFKMLESL